MTTKDDDTRDQDDDDDASSEDARKEPVRADADDDDDDDKPKPALEKPTAEAKPKRPVATASKKASKKPERRKEEGSPARIEAGSPASSGPSRAVLVAVIGIAVGVGGGWFLRDAKAKGRAPFKQAAAPAGSVVSGECKTWQDKICGESGAESAGCAQAKSAAELIPNAACGAALEDVPSTLARLKATREVCTDLVTKLCNELGNESDTCKMVKTKTERMTPENCRSMQDNYPQVIAQLKMMAGQGAAMGGMRPMGGRPMPPGGPGGPGGPGMPPPPAQPPPNPH